MREWLHSLRLRLRAVARRRQLEQDLRDEMSFHVAMRREQLDGSGAPNPDGEARRRFGNASRIADELRDRWALAPRLSSFARDCRYAGRALRRKPAFALVVILTLGIGIGINTATFSIVNAVLFRPLGFPEPERIVALQEELAGFGFGGAPFSPPDFLDLQREQQSFESVAAYRSIAIELSGATNPVLLDGVAASADLSRVLGAAPHLGRWFTVDEERPGVSVAVLGWALWQAAFNGDPSIVGRTITLDRRSYTVIGVMPRTFVFPRRGPQINNRPASLWVPLAFTDPQRQNRGNEFTYSAIGRLRRDRSLEQARTELSVLTQQVFERYPAGLKANGFAIAFGLTPLHEEIAGRMKWPLLWLLAAVGLVLLVTCANIANLVLSRAAARTREVALRSALGSSRARLLQLLLAEAAVLSIAGGLAGIAIAVAVIAALPSAVTSTLPAAGAVPLDGRVLLFSAGLAMATALVFAMVPLATIDGSSPGPTLQAEAARTTPGVRRHRIQATLVVSTVALSCVLLAGAGLFVRSFTALMATDGGFTTDRVLTAAVALPRAGYEKAASVRSFHDALFRQAASLPGVSASALTTDLPLESYERRTVSPEGISLTSSTPRNTNLSWIRGPYFSVLGIKLREGRAFTSDEDTQRRSVVVVNERLASAYWPGQSAIGKRLRWGLNVPQNPNPWLTIIGVVGNVADGSLGVEPYLHAYEPFIQFPDVVLDNFPGPFGRHVKAALRTQGNPRLLASALRAEIAGIDPDLAIQSISTMDDRLAEVVAPRRFSTLTLGAFAAGSLLLAGIGLYGLLAFSVAERRREIAVRLALGAEPQQIVRLVVGQGLALVFIGVVLGVGAAYSAAGAIGSFLYQTETDDLVAFAAVPVLLVTIALIACALPAYRASRVQSLTALRAD